MIMSESTQPTIVEYAEHQKAGVNALLYIHNHILEAARVADGVVPYNSNKFRFKELIAHIEGLGRPAAAQKEIDFTVSYDDYYSSPNDWRPSPPFSHFI